MVPSNANEPEVKAAYWRSALGLLLLWSVPALLSLYVKYKVMNFWVAAVQLDSSEKVDAIGRVVRDYSQGLTKWEKLSFFRGDLLIGLLLVPSCLLLLRRFLPKKVALATALLLSGSATFVLFVQLRAFVQVGQFISFSLIVQGIHWLRHEPAGLALVFRQILELAVGCLLIVGAAAIVVRLRPNLVRLTAPSSLQVWRLSVAVSMCCGLAATALAWVPSVPTIAYHQSILLRAIGALRDPGRIDTSEFRALKLNELARRYREMTHAPLPSRDSRYWGADANANVIFLVLETASYRALPLDQNLDDFPNLEQLRKHAFVGLSHRTTFPATREAVFSLFTSWYPDNGATWLADQYPNLAPPNIMRTLANRGYATGVYSPHEDNNALWQVIGVPHPLPADTPPASASSWEPSARVSRDVATLGLMEKDITGWLEQGRRFSVAFLPQISHVPWFEIKGPQADLLKRSRALLAYQDSWTGELIKLLQRHNALDDTVIVIVGDHGVRHRFEDPSCPAGMADAYTFHVPLLIYAPKALDSSRSIGWVTSHIDVAPTVLDLLGVAENRDFEQGTPIWNPELKNRTTYFFAWHFLGVDGYYEQGEFYAWRHLSDSVYRNESQHFEPPAIVPQDLAAFHDVERSVFRMTALQQEWVARFYSEKSSLRSRIY